MTPCQHGFTTGKSTDTANIEITEKILNSLNNNRLVACINCDLAKAFDLVDHDLLLRKLECYGVRGVPLDLFGAYLGQREQYTAVRYRELTGITKHYESSMLQAL